MRLKLYRGKWAVVGRDAQGRAYRRSLRTADRGTAERRFRDFRVETPGDTVADAAEIYLAAKEKAKSRSYQSMLTAWRALTPFFGNLRPDQITRDLCDEYAKMRRLNGVKDGTIIKDLGVLKAALRFAGKAAGSTFKMPPAPPPRERYITRAEHQRLMDAAELPHLKLFILLAWSTAARAGALFELTWGQVDFNRRQIKLGKPGQSGKGRATVWMTGRAKAALEDAYEKRSSDYVIEWGGARVRSVKRGFAAACAKAGLEDVTPHILRHSAAVAMAESGASMDEIAQVLGHTNPKVTFGVYARFSPEHKKNAMKALE